MSEFKWLIEDGDRPLVDIADDIEHTLPDLFWSLGLQAWGPHRWSTTSDEFGQLWIVLDVQTRPWRDPVRDRDRRATTPRETP